MAPRSVLRITPSNQELLQFYALVGITQANTEPFRTRPSYHFNLKCPICYEIPRESIFQCVNGHIICSTCCSKVHECPFCKVSFWTDTPGGGARKRIRALAIESMLDAMTFECPNKILGCEVILKRGDIKHHLKNDCVHEPPENREVSSDQEQEIDDQFDVELIDLGNINPVMRRVHQNRYQGNLGWRLPVFGTVLFLIVSFFFIVMLITSLVSDCEVKWVVISLNGRVLKVL